MSYVLLYYGIIRREVILTTQYLYHCIPNTPEGDSLRASVGYGADLTEDLKTAFNHFSSAKLPLVFAATKFSKALAFGFDCRIDEIIFNHSLEPKISDKEIIIICNRKKAIARERDVTVFKLSSSEFLPYNDEQWVRKSSIPFSECDVSYKAKSVRDLMKGGLQVLAFEESLQELNETGIADYIRNLPASNYYYKELGKLIRDKKLYWENKEQNIGVDKGLAAVMEIELDKRKTLKNIPSVK